MTLEHSLDIEITDSINVTLRYPRLKDLNGLSDELSDFEKTLCLLVECIESVTSDEEVINKIDMTQDEIIEFVDSFNSKQIENVMKFFETMPKLRHVVDVVNPKTKVKGEVLLEGLETFLG